MSKELEQEAKELVDVFKGLVPKQGSLHVGGRRPMNKARLNPAKQCAIKHCELMMKYIEGLSGGYVYWVSDENHYEQLIEEIKKL